MTDHKGIEAGALISTIVAINWTNTITVVVGVLSGLYYLTKLYKEWFGAGKQG